MFSDFDTKYTPKTLDDIVFQTADTRATVESIVNGTFGLPASGINAILLYGTYGSGKSALAKILPQLIERANGGDEAYASEFNISQGENGAGVIEQIKSQCNLVTLINKYHYFVLDEVDNLRAETMTTLKSAMNINAKNCIYIFTTNNLNKIEGGVLDRSVRIEFNAASSIDWLPKVKAILADYSVTAIADDELLKLIDLCNGSARKILSSTRQIIAKHKLLAA